MTNARLYINNLEVVGADMARVEINYEAGDLVGVVGQFFAVSTEFAVPIEDNLAALGFSAGNLSLKSYPPVAGDAKLLVNGADVLRLNGRYRLLGIDRVRGIARISVIGNNSNYASVLAGRRLRDLDLSVFDEPYAPTYIGDTGAGLWQPIIQSGRNDLLVFSANDYYYPGLKLSEILSRIFSGIDRSIRYGSTDVTLLFDRTHIFPGAGLMRNGARWLASLVETRALPNGGISGSGSLSAGASHSNFTDLVPGTVFSPENGGPCRLDYHLDVTITTTPTGVYVQDYTISLLYGTIFIGYIVPNGGTTGDYNGSFIWSKPFPDGSSSFTVRIEYFINAISGGGGATYNYSIVTSISDPLTITFTPLDGYNTDVVAGTTLSFENQLPDWDQRRFVEECARLAGSVVVEDVVNKTIGFYPMQRLTNPGTQAALPVNDWTDIVLGQGGSLEAATFDVDGVGQSTRFTYTHDEDTKPYTIADYTVSGNEVLPPLVEYGSGFADSLEGGVNGGVAALIPYWEPNDDNTSFTAKAVSPRILWRPEFIQRAFDGIDTPDFGVFDAKDQGETLGLRWYNLIRDFYVPLQNFAAEPATIEVPILFSASDMLQLLDTSPSPTFTPRILCPVYIGGQIGGKFKIKSINFVPNSEIQIATLIRL